jgi:hypothetical protein
LLNSIRDGNKLFLIGPRHFGKTSILKASDDQLYATDAVVLPFDAEGYPTNGPAPTLLASVISAYTCTAPTKPPPQPTKAILPSPSE